MNRCCDGEIGYCCQVCGMKLCQQHTFAQIVMAGPLEAGATFGLWILCPRHARQRATTILRRITRQALLRRAEQRKPKEG